MAGSTISKLKKLIAHERSARAIGSTAEAEAFAERIHEWLITHKLSLQEVELAPTEDGDIDGTALLATKREVWIECLAGAIAESYFCQAIARPGRDFFALIVIGSKADREVVLELLTYFVNIARELAEAETIRYRERLRTVKRGAQLGAGVKRYRNSFLTGFSLALCHRFRASKHNCEQSMALVRSDGKLEEFMSNFELGKPRKPYMPKLGEAGFISGVANGSRVALTARTLEDG